MLELMIILLVRAAAKSKDHNLKQDSLLVACLYEGPSLGGNLPVLWGDLFTSHLQGVVNN